MTGVDPAERTEASTADDALERVRLTRRLELWQRRRGHRSATDDVLCAWAALLAVPSPHRVLDLGCGHGAVTLMLAGAAPAARIVAVEAQAVSHALLVRNVEANDLGGRVVPVHRDLREMEVERWGPFDLVTGTPPYMPPGSGPLPRDPQRAAARFELRGGIEAYVDAARRGLAAGGVASLLMDGGQDTRCRRAVERAGLSLLRRVLIAPKAGAPVRFIAYQVQRTPARALPDVRLAVRDATGHWTAEYQAARETLDLPGTRG